MTQSEQREGKSWFITLLLAILFGFFGAHRFYTGYKLIGAIQFITLGGLGIWQLVDIIKILTGNYRDKYGNELANYQFHEMMKTKTPLPLYLIGIAAILTISIIDVYYHDSEIASMIKFICTVIIIFAGCYMSYLFYRKIHRKT